MKGINRWLCITLHKKDRRGIQLTDGTHFHCEACSRQWTVTLLINTLCAEGKNGQSSGLTA
jgi:hypothetical protein